MTTKKYELTTEPCWFLGDEFCIIVMAGPEKAEVRRVNIMKQAMESQKLVVWRVAAPISGRAAALPMMQIRALVNRFFFSYLSAMMPPQIPDVRPKMDRMTELTKEYWALKSGKFFKKKRGKK